MKLARTALVPATFAILSSVLLFGSAPVIATPPAPQAPQLTSEMLSGLRLRNIGPAVMSGRFVDIEGVEADPFMFYVASATGGVADGIPSTRVDAC